MTVPTWKQIAEALAMVDVCNTYRNNGQVVVDDDGRIHFTSDITPAWRAETLFACEQVRLEKVASVTSGPEMTVGDLRAVLMRWNANDEIRIDCNRQIWTIASLGFVSDTLSLNDPGYHTIVAGELWWVGDTSK